MSYWFSKSDDELAADRKWDTGTGFVLPTNADRSEAFKRVHLVESELIQASSDELEFLEFHEEIGETVGLSSAPRIALLLRHRR